MERRVEDDVAPVLPGLNPSFAPPPPADAARRAVETAEDISASPDRRALAAKLEAFADAEAQAAGSDAERLFRGRAPVAPTFTPLHRPKAELRTPAQRVVGKSNPGGRRRTSTRHRSDDARPLLPHLGGMLEVTPRTAMLGRGQDVQHRPLGAATAGSVVVR